MTKPKSRPPVKVVEVPLYGGRFCFISDRKTWLKMHDWMDAPKDDDLDPWHSYGMTSCYNDPRDGMSIITVGVFDFNPETIVHECAHAAFATLGRVGVDARNDLGEAFCYLQGWFFSHCLELAVKEAGKNDKVPEILPELPVLDPI